MEALIVIPTYNEKDNIIRQVEAIMKLPLNLSVVIVDDNSPDGTGASADKLSKRFERVKVIHRTGKGGRGSACIEGFKYAVKQDVEYIFEMDADLSHDPAEIQKFLMKMQDYDLVIGSRYSKDSKIVNWGKKRAVFSKLANLYARAVLGIPITDYTNGYRCYRKRVLENLEYDKIASTGYVVISEMTYQIAKKGYRIGEIPTVFVNRKQGKSNLSFKEISNAFISVIKLRFNCKITS
ncbi:MAG: polyprenol monophosphomannose synthase [Nitrospirota bacterium]